MVSQTKKSKEALIIHEYLTNPDNTIASIAKRLNIQRNTVDRVVNSLLEQKMKNIGRS